MQFEEKGPPSVAFGGRVMGNVVEGPFSADRRAPQVENRYHEFCLHAGRFLLLS